MPYFSPKEKSPRGGADTSASFTSPTASSQSEGADLLLSLSSAKSSQQGRSREGNLRSPCKKVFVHSPLAYGSDDSSSDGSAEVGVQKRSMEDDEDSRNHKRSRGFKPDLLNQSPDSNTSSGKRVISPTSDANCKVDEKETVAQQQTSQYGHAMPYGFRHTPPVPYPMHHAYGYPVYPSQFPSALHLGFSYPYTYGSGPTSYSAVAAHAAVQPPSKTHNRKNEAVASPSPPLDRKAPVEEAHGTVPRRHAPLRTNSSSSSDSGMCNLSESPPTVSMTSGTASEGQFGDGSCVMVPMTSELAMSNSQSTKSENIDVPDFSRLVNFPEYLNKGRTMATCPVAPAGKKYCVMCGKLRLCSSSGRGKAGKEDVSYIIPRQNKGVCTACDVAVWKVAAVPELLIKWCKGCKNYRQWNCFGEKGHATKCVRCRVRQKQKYASQKYGRLAKESESPTSAPKAAKLEDNDDYLLAAASLRKLRDSP